MSKELVDNILTEVVGPDKNYNFFALNAVTYTLKCT